ncbi:MAG: polymer-forming cytoskeletal protein [Caldilineales bacterium]|nr:polymer-forming cytoskeletal protein [Caldilineales bacterium]MCW5860514.1 polymer-forming cytoskeletal protein [Caldilineales bacterium]
MLGRQRRPEPDRIEVAIGPHAALRGEIKCEGSVHIEGVVEEGSRIETLGNIIIASDARVLADIKADVVSVSGAYKGELQANRVELLEGGRMWGVIRVASFLLDEGGYMRGELVMLTDSAQADDPWAPPAEAG